MKKKIIQNIILGGTLLAALGTVGHIGYKTLIENKYDKKDSIIDITGISIVAGAFLYSAYEAIKISLKEKQNKLEENLTK